ncbi:MAG TPA: aminotransferase class IV [Cyclobacteriaceae bacterium]|nr:aminotransferase class IV [Cyclobacteriaceae bacterium]
MSRLIESIRVFNGVPGNLELHNARMQRACKEVLRMKDSWDLERALSKSSVPANGLFKCRVVYDETDISISFLPYEPRPVNSLKIVHDNSISYDHKFLDRTQLERHFGNRGPYDDILIVKNGHVTDTSNANVVFIRNGEWFTPAICLLKGTMRQSLISSGRVRECEIRIEDIPAFQSFTLINAMILDEAPVSSTDRIYN